MRLREIKKIIDESIEGLDESTKQLVGGNFRISNFSSFVNSLDSLYEIPFFQNWIDEIRDTNMGGSRSDEFIISQSDYKSYLSKSAAFEIRVRAVSDFAFDYATPLKETTISLKLYQFGEFKNFDKFSGDFHKVILSPLKRLNIDVQIRGVESGSDWLNIDFENFLGSSLFFKIAQKAFNILVHDDPELRAIKKLQSQLELDNQDTKAILDILINKEKEIYEAASEAILSDLEGDDKLSEEELKKIIDLQDSARNELKSCMEKSIELTKDHMKLGLEVYESIDSPADKKRDKIGYKDFQNLLGDSPKQIEGTGEEEE